MATSRLQARYLHRLVGEIHYNVESGTQSHLIHPDYGPMDERRGYVQAEEFGAALAGRGFVSSGQARPSERMLSLSRRGINPIYPEKTQAGLRLLDRRGEIMLARNYPLRVYPAFDSIPPQIVKTLLFIENKDLLDSAHPYLNPAVDWSRMAKAVMELARQKLGRNGNVPGGSTLATQLEKYQHSEEGRTLSPSEKYRQMVSASLRAYQAGESTLTARKGIMLQYVNTVPLAALPGYGEVNGLYDGMLAWYGASLDSIGRLLRAPVGRGPNAQGIDTGVDMPAMGKGYRQVLNLFIAHRRPSSYLLLHRDALVSIGDNYLRVLGREGVISPQLRDAALAAHPELRRHGGSTPEDFVERKHVDAVRNTLAGMLGLPRLYDLDRLDLTVGTSLDGKVQMDVVRFLQKLASPAFVDSVGLKSFRMLDKGDPTRVVYSFTLYETFAGRNLLRVQADNYDQPLNINEGVKLDLGSTAKLRTLVHYLEIMSELHHRLAGKPVADNQALAKNGLDELTRWAADYLSGAKDPALPAFLDASLERKYSGDTREKFFTGSGVHTFVNFEANEGGVQSVKEAFRHSVNLVFIRLMRDVVNYHIAQAEVSRATLMDSSESPERRVYLARFAEQEGQTFLGRFFRKYRGMNREGVMDAFFQSFRPVPRRLASAYLYLAPNSDSASYFGFMRAQLGDSLFPVRQFESLREQFKRENLGLADLGFSAGVHPLELWLVGFLRAHPGASWSQAKEASRDQIQETYQWLFTTRHRSAQDIRIKTIMELEAFLEIHKAWQRVGYPFSSLVPSYATAIGSSADRPNALAELVGLIMNDGIRYPSVLIDRLRLAEGTPFESDWALGDTVSRRLLSLEVCQALRPLLLDVVEHGTAVRGFHAFPDGRGGFIPLGGKTGTGDQRFETFSKGGQLLESRAVNRTATFVFFLGSRFFGTVTAHVHGEVAKKYDFTSSMPVQILRLLQPSLKPLLEAPPPSTERPDGFPMALDEPRFGRMSLPSSLVRSQKPPLSSQFLSQMLLGPSVPDTTQLPAEQPDD